MTALPSGDLMMSLIFESNDNAIILFFLPMIINYEFFPENLITY